VGGELHNPFIRELLTVFRIMLSVLVVIHELPDARFIIERKSLYQSKLSVSTHPIS
jgi:hypothetical protein